MTFYTGYKVEIKTPSSANFSKEAIRETLKEFDGMSIYVVEAPGGGKPRLVSVTFPLNVKLGAVFIGKQEIPNFGEQAFAFHVQSLLSRMKPAPN